MVKELKDYPVSDVKAVAAETQTKDAWRGTVAKLWSGEDVMAPMASMASMVVWTTQEGTDVEVPLVAMVVTNQRTRVVCLTVSRLPVVFAASVRIETNVTVFPMGGVLT